MFFLFNYCLTVIFLNTYSVSSLNRDSIVLTKYRILATFARELCNILPAGLKGVNLMNNEIEVTIKKSKMFAVFLFLEKYT